MWAIGIIPARYASERFPGKPLAKLLGRPMVCWVAERVSRADLLDKVIVATDDERIAEAVGACGFEAVITSARHSSGSDRVWEVARCTDAEVVVNIQGDEPTVTAAAVDACLRPLRERDDVDVVTLRTTILEAEDLRRPDVVKVATDAEGFALYFSRSPIPYPGDGEPDPRCHFRHVGIYAYRRDALQRFCQLPPSELELKERLEQLRGLEARLRYLVVETGYRSVDVNTPADIARAEEYLRGSGGGGKE